MPKKIDKVQVEQRMLEKHNYRYSYDLTNYKNTRSLVSIQCPVHGVFQQKVTDHLYSGCGCPSCDITRKFTTEDFIQKSKLVHGDKYDYTLSKYGANNYDKVIITCMSHGQFLQTPWAHMRGQGCPFCANNRLFSNEEFIEKCKKKHNDIYDYTMVDYKGKNDLVKIICKKHGEFEQLARLHLAGFGCKKCRMSKLEIWIKDFLSERKIYFEFNKKFEDLKDKRKLSFDFWLPDYSICIECDGIQHQKAIPFFGGDERLLDQQNKDKIKDEWCQNNSIWLLRVNDFKNPFEAISKSLVDKTSKCIPNDKKNLPSFNSIKPSNLEIDDRGKYELIDFIKNKHDIEEKFILDNEEFIRIKENRLLIKYIDFFNYCEINSPKKRIMSIYDIAQKNDFKVIQIYQDDWQYKKEIIKSRIDNLSGLSTRIYARKTEIRLIEEFGVMKSFLDESHIQGFVPSKYKIGIYFNLELVGILTMSDLRINLGQKKEVGTYEILRYACRPGINIIGGFDKALQFFIKKFRPNKIVSYANRMWSNENNVYSKIGMKLESISDPSYFYIVGNKREGRFTYRKDILINKWGFKADMTEHSIMLSNGVYRIFDAGSFKYTMIL